MSSPLVPETEFRDWPVLFKPQRLP
jgi:hypothetical protein